MFRTLGFTATLLTAAAVAQPAAAQSWGFDVGVGFGGPAYYGPPPVYQETPVYRGRPRVIYREAPAFAEPQPGIIPMQAPEIVFDRLEAAGYSELSPMARRGTLYKLNAVDPEGNIVALEISIFSGEIERAAILQRGRAAPRQAARPARRAPAAKAAPAAPVTAAAAPPPPPPPAPAAASQPPPASSRSSDDSPSTLRDRLQSQPAAPEEPAEGDDPLVVY